MTVRQKVITSIFDSCASVFRSLERVVGVSILLLLWNGCDFRMPEKVCGTHQIKKLERISVSSLAGTSRVLVVHSYNTNYPWVWAIQEGIESVVLQEPGIELYHYYMDTKTRTGEAWKRESGRLAVEETERLNPDVIITADDNAQEYYVGLLPADHAPVVFCGVNSDPAKYGFPNERVCGVIERPQLMRLLADAQKIMPITNVLFISSHDPTSVGTFSYMQQVYTGDVHVDWELISSVDNWKQTVIEAKDNYDALLIYNYHTLKEEENGPSADSSSIMRWTVENSALPVLGFNDFSVEDGVLLAVLVSGWDQGAQAARYAIELLHGRLPGELPIVSTQVGKRLINENSIAKFGITVPLDWETNLHVYTKEGVWQND